MVPKPGASRLVAHVRLIVYSQSVIIGQGSGLAAVGPLSTGRAYAIAEFRTRARGGKILFPMKVN